MAIKIDNKITGYTSLYKVEPKIYRAGVSLEAAPQNLPVGMKYEAFVLLASSCGSRNSAGILEMRALLCSLSQGSSSLNSR